MTPLGIAAGVLIAYAAGNVIRQPSAMARDANHTIHIMHCQDSPTPGIRPAATECALLARKRINSLPLDPIVWRLETFASLAAARRAETTTSIVANAGGRIWLITLATKGQRSFADSDFVAEVGPISIPRARRYDIIVGEAYSRPGASTRVHTHPGPEAWYVINGQQCLETPHGVLRAAAGQGSFVAADTPMKLKVVGTSTRDALFFEVGDAAQPWTAASKWQSTERCESR
jgi:hypothetical protein